MNLKFLHRFLLTTFLFFFVSNAYAGKCIVNREMKKKIEEICLKAGKKSKEHGECNPMKSGDIKVKNKIRGRKIAVRDLLWKDGEVSSPPPQQPEIENLPLCELRKSTGIVSIRNKCRKNNLLAKPADNYCWHFDLLGEKACEQYKILWHDSTSEALQYQKQSLCEYVK